MNRDRIYATAVILFFLLGTLRTFKIVAVEELESVAEYVKQFGKGDLGFDKRQGRWTCQRNCPTSAFASHRQTWGDKHNLDLSNRRATAVKRVLVEKYRIEENRLTAVGFGATGPKESNETLEGRARNRRVELVRQ